MVVQATRSDAASACVPQPKPNPTAEPDAHFGRAGSTDTSEQDRGYGPPGTGQPSSSKGSSTMRKVAAPLDRR